MENNFYRHYITVAENGCILDGFSDAFHQPTATDICINEQGGYQFRLFPAGEDNPPLRDGHGIPRYKYNGGAVIERSAEEIAQDVAAIPSVLSREDRMEAQITYTAMMTDTLLEG